MNLVAAVADRNRVVFFVQNGLGVTKDHGFAIVFVEKEKSCDGIRTDNDGSMFRCCNPNVDRVGWVVFVLRFVVGRAAESSFRLVFPFRRETFLDNSPDGIVREGHNDRLCLLVSCLSRVVKDLFERQEFCMRKWIFFCRGIRRICTGVGVEVWVASLRDAAC